MTRSSKKHVDVLIIGGGLAGLSCAYHLRKSSYLLVEREKEVGGTARSIELNGFTFDFTGHLLHLHHAETRRLITRLLRGQFFTCQRKTSIYSHGRLTKYPFQAFTRGLPDRVLDDCVLSFFDAYLKNSGKKISSQQNLKTWSQALFGAGITRHFMKPYNEKLYQTPFQKMTADWCGPFVPMPSLEEVLEGALIDGDKRFGYNATFIYPKKGGIQALPQALAKNLRHIRLGTSLVSWDPVQKEAQLSSGEVVSYRHMVNTIPLVECLKRMKSPPRSIQRAQKALKWASILCLNIGVDRAHLSDRSWIYFPEKEFLFYRVGFPMNFTPHVVPKGCSSLYVEIPMKAIRGWSRAHIIDSVTRGLERCGILKKGDKQLAQQFLPIRYAYVVYDKNRQRELPKILSYLNKNDVQSIGRYGGWKYSFMEEAIRDGKAAARQIENKRS